LEILVEKGDTVVNKTDISEEMRWLYEERAKKVVTSLQKKNINARYVSGRQKALSAVMEMIPEGATVTRGDSISLDQVGVIPELRKRNQNEVTDPFEEGDSGGWIVEREQRHRMQREAFSRDVFLTSTNAITLDGKLVNTDGHGNRVAAMVFGPEMVIVVAGANKIVKDVNEAMERIRQVCAPLNARRHYQHHQRPEFGELPCVRTGGCVDCNHDWNICRYTVIIEGAMVRDKGRINVVMVGEELGI
jgi:hypothetical protein